MSTLASVFGYGLLSARAAASVAGRFYYATDTALIYRDNGSTWNALSVGAGSMATDVLWDAKGDLAAGTGADAASKVTVGANKTILMADSSQTTGLKWLAVGAVTEATLGGDVTMTTADTFYDGPTITPAAGDYDVWARVVFGANTGSQMYFVARLIANGSATPVDEVESQWVMANTSQMPVILAGRVAADGTNPILVRGTSSNNGQLMKRDPANDSSALHRATLLRIVRVS